MSSPAVAVTAEITPETLAEWKKGTPRGYQRKLDKLYARWKEAERTAVQLQEQNNLLNGLVADLQELIALKDREIAEHRQQLTQGKA